MKLRNKATVMLGVLAASAAANFALAVPAITYAAENANAPQSAADSFRKAFEKQTQDAKDSLAKRIDSGNSASKPLKDTVVDVVVELDSAPAIKHIKNRPDGTKKSLKEIKEKSDSVIGEQDSVIGEVDSVSKYKFKNNKHKQFGYLVNAFTTQAKLSELDSIAALPGVKSVGKVNTFTTQDADANDLDSVQNAWNGVAIPGVKLHGEGMVIAIIDTGIDYKHTDLSHAPDSARLSEDAVDELVKTNGLKGKYFTPKVPYAYNYADQNWDVVDADWHENHGMHVAGIAAADGTDYLKDSARAAHKSDSEIAGLVADNQTHVDGAAPQAQLLDLKVFSNRANSSSCDTPKVIAAIEDAVKLGADIISMSLGSDNGEAAGTDIEDMAIEKAADAGVISVIAAGNAGDHNSMFTTAQYAKGGKIGISKNTQTVGAPGVNPYALTVAASQNKGVALPGLDIFDESDNRIKLFDSLDGMLAGPFSAGLGWGEKEFPNSEFEVVTLKDNHSAYWNSMRADQDATILNLLGNKGIQLALNQPYNENDLVSTGVKTLGLDSIELDSPAVSYSAWASALSTRGLDTINGVFDHSYMGVYDPDAYNVDSLTFGQGYQTDIQGYSGNWHDPLHGDSSAHPGTSIEGKIVIVPYGVYTGQYSVMEGIYNNLVAQKPAGIIYVAPKEWTPTSKSDYVAFERTKAQYAFNVDVPAIIIPQNDGIKLAKNINARNEAAINANKDLPKYHFKNVNQGIENLKVGKMAEYSSYGPTDELELKPEITAVGSDVWSLKNQNKFQYLSGTSMATPQVSGITALLLQHLKSFDDHKTGKDLIKQAKNLLMNAAEPIFESPFSSVYGDLDVDEESIGLNESDNLKWSDIDGLVNDYDHDSEGAKDSYRAQTTLVSPRRQGAGEVNAARALSSTTSLTDKKDGDVSLALKEIGEHTSFSVVLKNFGDKTKSYQLDSKYDHVYTQNEVLDDTSRADGLIFARQLDFPLKKDIASLSLSKGYDETITLAPGDSITINGTLDVNDPNLKENWLEGYVGVKEIGSDETAVIPYFGYTGKTDDTPIFDKFYGEDSCVGGQMQFVTGNPNRPRNNTWIGVEPDQWGKDSFNESKVAFAPGHGDRLAPAYTVLRNNKSLQFNILDSNKNLIRTLQTTAHQFPNTMRYAAEHAYLDGNAKWDGTIWNAEKDSFEQMPEGQYYYQFKGTGTRAGDTEQTRDVEVTIDNTAPTISGVKLSKDNDGAYWVDAEVIEKGAGFNGGMPVGIALNGANTNLGANKDVFATETDGTYKVHAKIPTDIAKRIVSGSNELSLGIADAADNEIIYSDVVPLYEGADVPTQQGFRLTRPYYSGSEDSQFVILDPQNDYQVDLASKLIHIKGFSDKAFYVNKDIKVTPNEQNEFDSWIPYDYKAVHEQMHPVEMPDGKLKDVKFEGVRDLNFSWDVAGEDVFKVVNFATDVLPSDGKPIYKPEDLWSFNVLIRDGGKDADNSIATEAMRLEIDRLNADQTYSHDSIVQRPKEFVWVTNKAGQVDINPNKTLSLEDSAGERPFARVLDEHKNDRFVIINLSTGEYEQDGKVYSKGGDELPAQSFKPDTSNYNSITSNFITVDKSNVVEIKDLDDPSYNSFTFVYAIPKPNGYWDFDFGMNSQYKSNPNGGIDVSSAAVKAGDYIITDPATGDGTFKLKGNHYDRISNMHILTPGDLVPNDGNKVTEGERDPETGKVEWTYNVKIKNGTENAITVYYNDETEDGVIENTGYMKFDADVLPPTLQLGDKFKAVPVAPTVPVVHDPLSVFDALNDLGEFTTNSTTGKLDLAGIFGDNQWSFTLKINGNQIYRSTHENQDGPWPGETIDLHSVDFGNLLDLIPGVDNSFVIDVTDAMGNVTRAHIHVTQTPEPAVTPGDDGSSDSQDFGDAKEVTAFYDLLKAVPDEIKSYDDADKIAELTLAYNALSSEDKATVKAKIADIETKINAFQTAAGVVNHKNDDAKVEGADLPWNYRLVTDKIDETDARYADFASKLAGEALQNLFDIHLIDVLDGDKVVEPHAVEKVTLRHIDLTNEAALKLHHEHGTFDDVALSFDDAAQTLSFETSEFSLFGLSTTLAAGPTDSAASGVTESATADSAAATTSETTTANGKSTKTGLPATGEEAATWIAYAGIVLLTVGGSLVLLRKRRIAE
ncbi:MAG: S8 family serine peptidase [Lactobacillales bacterium]|jgi:LPXTG-motif cell wall-anchored protein|nr:S8 family serine peptidase [Lactobacillales bacterium]